MARTTTDNGEKISFITFYGTFYAFKDGSCVNFKLDKFLEHFYNLT